MHRYWASASAAFGKMQDYGLHDNTVDDVQDGVLKLGDAYTKLADSKAKLKEMEENPSEYSDVRIQAQRDEVQAYSQDIEDLSDNMQYYIEHQADEYNKQQQTAKEAIMLLIIVVDGLLRLRLPIYHILYYLIIVAYHINILHIVRKLQSIIGIF